MGRRCCSRSSRNMPTSNSIRQTTISRQSANASLRPPCQNSNETTILQLTQNSFSRNSAPLFDQLPPLMRMAARQVSICLDAKCSQLYEGSSSFACPPSCAFVQGVFSEQCLV